MEISYKKVGDYYIPEMVFPNAKLDKNIGKYGRLRLNYLKRNHMDIYTILLMDDKLNEHLLEIEKEAKEQVKILVENMCKKENVTEKLKENNQMTDLYHFLKHIKMTFLRVWKMSECILKIII